MNEFKNLVEENINNSKPMHSHTHIKNHLDSKPMHTHIKNHLDSKSTDYLHFLLMLYVSQH
jgi:hypothetical protein